MRFVLDGLLGDVDVSDCKAAVTIRTDKTEDRGQNAACSAVCAFFTVTLPHYPPPHPPTPTPAHAHKHTHTNTPKQHH